MNKIFTKVFYTVSVIIFFLAVVQPVSAQLINTTVETGRLYSASAKDASNNIYVIRVKPGSGGTIGEVVKYNVGIDTAAIIYTGLHEGDDTGPGGDLPWGLAVTSNGDVYVSTDFSVASGKIIKLKLTSGTYTASTFQSGAYYTALAVDAANNIYATQYDGATNYAVYKYAANSANGVAGVKLYGNLKQGAGYSYPTGLAVAANGDIYVTDAFAEDLTLDADGGHIYKLTAASNFVTAVTVSTGNYATALTLDAAGNLYTAENTGTDANGYKLLKYTNGGGTPTVLYTPLHTNGLYYPYGVSVISSTNIYVIDGDDGTTGGSLDHLSPPSNNALLTSLNFDPSITKTTVAGPDYKDYTASVSNGVYTIGVIPTAQNATATIKVNGVAVLSGTESAAIPLNVGPNTITTIVTAQDGTTTKSYVTNIYREPVYSPNLVSLTLDKGTLSPAFAENTTAYTDTIGPAATITVTPVTASQYATLTVNGTPIKSGVATSLPLISGPNVITIVVTAQDGTTTKTYSIAVLPAPPNISYSSPQVYALGTTIPSLVPSNSGSPVPATLYGQTLTLAGTTTAGSANGTGAAASFKNPSGVGTDVSGNIYVADYTNNLIRKITPGGVVTTLAGTTTAGNVNGTGTAARFRNPSGVVVDASGNVYVADGGNNEIRKITPGGVVTTLAGSGPSGYTDGTGSLASFNNPRGLAIDGSGNLYVADYGNNEIRKITPGGVVTTLAGTTTAGSADGTGTGASFHGPFSVCLDVLGNLYVSDYGNNEIREITPAGVVTTVAGATTIGNVNGTGSAARFHGPLGITIDGGGVLYIADGGNNEIRRMSSVGVVTTIAGATVAGSADGIGSLASFSNPRGVAADTSGNVYVADYGNNEIRRLITTGYTISAAPPAGLVFDGTTGIISGTPSAVSAAANYTVTAYNKNGSDAAIVNIAVTLQPPHLAYNTPDVYTLNSPITPLMPSNSGSPVPATTYSQVTRLAGSGTAGSGNGTGTAASFKSPWAVATDASGNSYVADYGNNVIRKITPGGVVTTLAGSGTAGNTNGTGTAASFSGPAGIAVDGAGNVYVGDGTNNLVRKITPAGVVTTLAGSGTAGNTNGTGTSASFSVPRGLVLDGAGNVYVADYGNNLIRRITPAGVVTTFAGSGTVGSTNGTGTAASFHSPIALSIDGAGNIYVADYANNQIRKITPGGVVTTLAGSGTAGSTNGTGTAASFKNPFGLTADGAGNVYVADGGNNLVRRITPGGVVTTFAGSGTAGTADGTGTGAQFNNPHGIAADGLGNLYLADYGSSIIRRLIITGYTISPALPAGLAFDGTTGIISGTPTTITAAAGYTATAYNVYGSGTEIINITISAPPPSITYTTPDTYTAGTSITPLSPTNSGGAVPATTYSQVTRLAGSGTAGLTNGTGTAASFKSPWAVATDASGNSYVADYGNNVIRKITPGGVVTTLAGSGTVGNTNGTGTAASFSGPAGIAVDGAGNVYVGDGTNNLVRKITPAGVVTTLAGSGTAGNTNGTGTAASFSVPRGLVLDGAGNVYVADYGNNLIRRITPAGVVTTFAGSGTVGSTNGTGTAASFHSPIALSIDGAGNIYAADYANNQIRKITPGGVVTTLAGSGTAGSTNGTGTAASFKNPFGLTADGAGNVYVADGGNNLVRRITPGGVVTTFAGSGTAGTADGTGTGAQFNNPHGIAADGLGNVYLADYGSSIIRRLIITGYTISPALPAGLTFSSATGTISGTPTTAAAAANYTVTAYNTAGSGTAIINITINGSPAISYSTPQMYTAGTSITPLSPTNSGGAVPATTYSQVTRLAGSGTAGLTNGTGTGASFKSPWAVATDASGNSYVADYGNNVIRKITPGGVVTTLAGSGTAGNTNGTGTAASFSGPAGIAVDGAGNVYVGDGTNNLVRKITPAGVVTTLAGSGTAGNTNGTGTSASFSVPRGLVLDGAGNVYVADYGNNLIRRITPAGVVTTFAGSGTVGSTNGTGTAASFHSPIALTIDGAGNIYVADYANNQIRKITPGGVVTTLAGSGTAGSTNGTGTAASFKNPFGLTADGAGNVYVADGGNNLVRRITPGGVVTTFAGSGTAGTADGTGTGAQFNNPHGIAADGLGNVYLADYGSSIIRRLIITGYTISPALPAGLAFDGTTGTISGTPTAVTDTVNYIVTAYNTYGSGTAIINIAVNAPVPNAAVITDKIISDSQTEPRVIASLSPNGDGRNDVLQITNIEKYPDNKLTIINRAGAEVYYAAGYDNQNKAFDGHSNKTRELQKPGTYFYRLEYKDSGKIKYKTGYIVLKY